ncbi:hypothetical protein [Micromonospora violae]|uniref:hypothetical protein n=1 Tax=Micromonospora violae TaxID=1278207 RepID=UPI0033C1C74F
MTVLLSACTPSGDARQRTTPPTNRAAPSTNASAGGPPCTTAVDALAAPPAGYRLVGKDVAVPDAPVMSVESSGEADPAARLFAKWGLVVRAGRVVDLRVAPGWQDKARLGWGGTGTPAATATVHACPPEDEQAQWMAFVGGTWVARAACVPLTVTSGGRDDRVDLGIGVACDKNTAP